jgi:hypothetical protein
MRRALIAVFLMVAVALGPATVGLAVTNGQPDGNGHPYVGIAIQDIPSMPGYVYVCSGSLVSSRVFVTAAHCFDPAAGPVYVSFKSEPPFGAYPGKNWVAGSYYRDPAWCLGCASGLPGFDTHDVAVVVLKHPTNPGVYAALPSAGLVDTLPMKADVDIVGYGVQGFIRGGGQPGQEFLFTRYFAPSQLIDANFEQSDEYIKLTANPAQGKGGTCFGDSGGPDLKSGTNIILAVNSYVTNGNCAGVTYSNRIDLQYALDFINSFMK